MELKFKGSKHKRKVSKRTNYRVADFSELIENGLVIISIVDTAIIRGRRQYTSYRIMRRKDVTQKKLPEGTIVLRSTPPHHKIFYDMNGNKFLLKDARYE